MKKTAKKILLSISLCAAVACTAGALSACETDFSGFPDYKGAIAQEEEVNTTDKYVVNTLSVGGIRLAGVKVTALKDGQEVKSGRSNEKGQVAFSLPEGVYSLEYDDLPDGYYAQEGTTINATPEKYGSVDARFPSKVITTSASGSVLYSLGDVMHDFRFKDSNGTDYRLSELLAPEEEAGKGYKAVVLNFWYTTCGPCMSEIPAMQKAYESYSDKVALLALSNQDDNEAINRFKNNLDTAVTFAMGYDSMGLYKNFSVTAYPTTVVIDRYGAIAQVETGAMPAVSSWIELFSRYTSDKYTQSITPSETPGDEDVFVPEQVNIPDPSYEDLKNALVDPESTRRDAFTFHGETVEQDKPYSWPWLKGEDENNVFAEASNKGKRGSFANLYCAVNIRDNEVLSVDYNISIRNEMDFLYVLIKEGNGSFKIVTELTGNSDGWETLTLFRSNKDQTIEVAFCYQRSQVVTDTTEYTDTARINNFSIRDAENSEIPTDIVRDVATKLNAAGTRYEKTVELIAPENTPDGYYHVVTSTSEPGAQSESILYADILNASAWSRLNLKNDYFTAPDGILAQTSLYHLSYWQLSNYERADSSVPLVLFEGSDPKYRAASDTIIEQYYMQLFSDNGYIPVSTALKEAIEVFLEVYSEKNNLPTYEDQWLEFCYYFDHYGEKHTGDEHCSQSYDPVKGMSNYNAFETKVSTRYIKENPNHVNIYRGKNNDPAVRFRFTPAESGTYRIYTDIDFAEDNITDPFLFIVSEDGRYLYEEDDCLLYDRFTMTKAGNMKYGLNFDAYYYFEKGVTVYLNLRMKMPGALGEYDFYVEKIAGEEEVNRLLVCTTGEGVFSPVGENGALVYIAIDVAYDATTNLWYADEDGHYGSPIYVDFIHGNFLDQDNKSVKDMIDIGAFDFRKYGGKDYTATMLEYYNRAVAAEKEGSELYGLIEADKQLVNILDYLSSLMFEQNTGTKCWLSMACYYKSYGPKA